MNARSVGLLLALGLPLAASARPIQAFKCTMPPGGYSEIDLKGEAGGAALGRWKAAGTLAWNVHVHEHGKANYVQKGKAKQGEIRYGTKESGAFSFMWVNEGKKPVDFDVTVTGDLVTMASFSNCYPGTPKK